MVPGVGQTIFVLVVILLKTGKIGAKMELIYIGYWCSKKRRICTVCDTTIHDCIGEEYLDIYNTFMFSQVS